MASQDQKPCDSKNSWSSNAKTLKTCFQENNYTVHHLSNMLLSIMKLKKSLYRNFPILQSNAKRARDLVAVILGESLQAKTTSRVI